MRLLFILLVGVCFFAGCTAINYKSLPVDSASPTGAEKYTKKCPAKLANKEECVARINADQWATPTGIQVSEANEAYCIELLPNQVWFDAERRNTPPLGEEGSWIMKRFEKRHPESGYFSLMVAVQPDPLAFKTNGAEAVAGLTKSRYTAIFTGALVLYPNDAIGPSGNDDYFYKNNSGYVWVKINRC